MMTCFFVAVFKDLFLSVTSTMLTMVCLGVDLFAFILLEVHWTWCVDYSFSSNLETFYPLFIWMFFLLFSVSSGSPSILMDLMVFHVSLRLLSFFPSPLCLQITWSLSEYFCLLVCFSTSSDLLLGPSGELFISTSALFVSPRHQSLHGAVQLKLGPRQEQRGATLWSLLWSPGQNSGHSCCRRVWTCSSPAATLHCPAEGALNVKCVESVLLFRSCCTPESGPSAAQSWEARSAIVHWLLNLQSGSSDLGSCGRWQLPPGCRAHLISSPVTHPAWAEKATSLSQRPLRSSL